MSKLETPSKGKDRDSEQEYLGGGPVLARGSVEGDIYGYFDSEKPCLICGMLPSQGSYICYPFCAQSDSRFLASLMGINIQ